MKRSFILLSLIATVSMTLPSVASCAPLAGSIVRDTLLGVPCRVYLPALYTDTTRSDSTVYPVLYLQHGMFGSEDDWTMQGHLERWMNMLLMAQQVKEMVVIMPDNFLGSIPEDERKALMESPNIKPTGEVINTDNGSAHWQKLTSEQEQAYEMSGFWEEHFREFMTQAEERYRISKDPSKRAIAGLSMGGFHTMHVAHHLHGQFAYVGLFSAVIIPHVGDVQVAVEVDSPFHTSGFDYQNEYSSPVYTTWMADMRRMASAAPMYWIGMGRDDFLYAQMQDYRMWLDQNNFEYTYYESKGGHTWDNWEDYLCRFLKKLFWDEKF